MVRHGSRRRPANSANVKSFTPLKHLKMPAAGGVKMNETVTINNEDLAILCDLMSGWGVKKWAENPGTAKKQALDRLIAHGYVELAFEELRPPDTDTRLKQKCSLLS